MGNVMFDYIPEFFRDAENFKALLDTNLVQFDKFDDLVADIIDQLYVDTATWGLKFWEYEYGLDYNPSLTYEVRRSRVKAKIRGIGKVDRKLISSMASAYSDGEVDVTFDGRINIKFIGTRGIPAGLIELKKQLEEIRPAGLEIFYDFNFNPYWYAHQFKNGLLGAYTWYEIRNIQISEELTHERLSNLTHGRLEAVINA